ncbi:GCN5-like N-acetyltransferase [Planoprotostelium fungivorum]|uniref:GCN5-like N-acetyltransferase n=1 Tax=Planoprotostelium fungivorum TaxID=1890364 RepID=A0A2P6N0D7_9EUKA|nr:GCN5-like N-acetyltransferase [Planoprotostelium fungivorum]
MREQVGVSTSIARDPSFINNHFISDFAKFGWNPLDSDAETYADVGKFLVIHKEDAKDPCGCVVVFPYETNNFLGYFYMKEEWRGKGLGSKLLSEALELVDGPIGSLDSVEEHVETYARRGFHPIGSVLSMETSSFHVPNVPVSLLPEEVLVDLAEVSIDDVIRLEHEYTGVKRTPFWKHPKLLEGSKGVAILHNGSLRAYIICKPSSDGCKISPLYASEVRQARLLLNHLSDVISTYPTTQLDCWGNNEEAERLFIEYGMERTYTFTRMWKGGIPLEQHKGGSSERTAFCWNDAATG